MCWNLRMPVSTSSVSAPTCERLSCPLGIDEGRPRLGWIPIGAQAAYQIIVADSKDAVASGLGTHWDSGWVEGNECSVSYGGTPLCSRSRYWFRVWVRDEAGSVSDYCEPSWFETGLFQSDSWPSDWIKASIPGRGPAPVFLRDIRVEKPVRSARAYVCGLGYSELRVNARRSGESVLDPAWMIPLNYPSWKGWR